jgi:hypothetical protein
MSEITRVLASDEFQGRSMGGPGEEKTVAYLTEQFKAAGLEPGGENGRWTQTVPMIRTKLQAPMAFSVKQGSRTLPLRFPDDIYLSTVRDTDRAKIAGAPMVFVGYGVNAPERGWDDFKDVDLKGKVAVFLVNDPDFEAIAGEPVAGKFSGQTMTYYGRWTYKFDEAARRDRRPDRPRHAGRGLRLERRPERGGRELQHRPFPERAAAGAPAGLDPRSSRGGDVQARRIRSRTAAPEGADRGVQAGGPQGDLLGQCPGRASADHQPQRYRQADRLQISE